MNFKLSILIVTQGRRQQKLRRLLGVLMPQLTTDVEILLYQNNCEESIGFYRKALVEASRGKYVCFIDDDDLVPDDYVAVILAHLGKDYLGFQVKLTLNGREERKVFHSLRYATWDQDNDGFYRNITHLNPIKRSIAVQGTWPTHKYAGEDVSWANSVKHLTHTEQYIDRVMYYYIHDSADTSFGGPEFEETNQYLPGIVRL